MKLVKLTATALTITFVATVLIKADQFLSRDPLTQKEKDPVRIDTVSYTHLTLPTIIRV